ncbi:4-alpha-glucanotransferase [Corynebacterium sp. HS2168-gen11]|uniref:4-alpha-glucanotransferase n=1 Tax=Corynebacterium sp. HS2168-gen11 TaxID=2974027 RepID=UPI00216ABCB8|nr:4-alpha-glucanotransferase [Corynebacterium sp. HS2168-gen11]MCS4535391.1 4-alpha-glucanotransferase [Corynebacterium sp. HS2168-gen11]
MGYQESLRELAAAYAISTGYTDSEGHPVEVSEDTLLKTLHALGVDLGESPSEADIHQALSNRYDQEFTRPLPRCIVTSDESNYVVHVHVHDGAPAEVSIELEDGTLAKVDQVENWTPSREIHGTHWGEASFNIPAGLPQGWHTLKLVSEGIAAQCPLIVTPARLSTTQTYIEKPVAGVMAQIYSVRSEKSWGIGDFHDLGQLGAFIAQQNAGDFLLINPMHAAEPFAPIEDSPYLPTTRRFTNPIYIRIEDIPEYHDLEADVLAAVEELAQKFQATNRDASMIDRNPIYQAKLEVLREIFHVARSSAREAEFRNYIAMEGTGLEEFAAWCARQEAAAMSANHAVVDMDELAEFYMWLQWICDAQLAAAQQACTDAGMKIGIMADLAVGVHPGGSDAETLAAVLAPEASVGAPPDAYNQQGQDWSQPPWHPEKLAEVGYKPWRDMLRTVLRHSGGIRVDHVLGLFRLFWIPRLQSPTTGTYVNYDYRALVGILALEAERAGAVVIGEDLGTFEPWVQEALASYGIMGTNILWFESDYNGPRHKEDYRTAALSSVTTHDLPPTAGYLEGEHIKLRERLGLLLSDANEDIAQDLHWQAQVLNRVLEQGGFAGEEFNVDNFEGRGRDDRGETETLVAAMHRFIAQTPSALTCTALVDMVGDRRVQNQPGTTKDLYPNWCVPLSNAQGEVVLIEDLASNNTFAHIAAASRRS